MPKRVDRVREVERALGAVYIRYFNQIKKEKGFPWDMATIKTKYNDQVYGATRKAVEEVYTEGANYTGAKLKEDVYSSDTDVQNIKDKTDKALAIFWFRITEDAKRTREQEVETERQLKDRETESFLNTVAGIVSAAGLAFGTLSKIKQIFGLKRDRTYRVRWVAQMDEVTCKELPNGDPGCWYLHGKTWDIGDPSIPIPGELGDNGTHPNCHCFIEVI